MLLVKEIRAFSKQWTREAVHFVGRCSGGIRFVVVPPSPDVGPMPGNPAVRKRHTHRDKESESVFACVFLRRMRVGRGPMALEQRAGDGKQRRRQAAEILGAGDHAAAALQFAV